MIALLLAIIRKHLHKYFIQESAKPSHRYIAFILYRYGSFIRARSPAAIQLARQLEEAERKRAERQAAREQKTAAIAGTAAAKEKPAANA